MLAALHSLDAAGQTGALFGMDQAGFVALGLHLKRLQRHRQLIAVVEQVVDEDDPLILDDVVVGCLEVGGQATGRGTAPCRRR